MVAKFNSMSINIFVQSKQKKHLFEFIKIFGLLCKKQIKSINVYLTKKKLKFFFSLLTSPHVNKRAQEQFGTLLLNLQVRILTFEYFKFIILFKRLYLKVFPNLKLKINLNTCSINYNRCFLVSIGLLKITEHLPKKTRLVKSLDNSGI